MCNSCTSFVSNTRVHRNSKNDRNKLRIKASTEMSIWNDVKQARNKEVPITTEVATPCKPWMDYLT